MKKNIMFLIGDMTNGGAERVVSNLCNNLKDEYDVTLVVRTMEDADYKPEVDILEVPELGSFRPRGLIKIIKTLKKIKTELNIDTSISFLTKYNIYNYLSKCDDKVVMSVRNVISENNKEKSKIIKWFYKYSLRRADLVVNVSEAARVDSIKNFGAMEDKCIVIPNFCETEKINKLMVEPILKEYKHIFDGRVIISAGRYSDQKGHWHIIRAFKKVVENHEDANLVLLGKGELKDYYLELIKDLNLEKSVFVLDFDPNIYRYMHNSYIHILNSFHEGMPNVVLEAMACGIPSIVTDAKGGSKEIVDPKNVNEPMVDKMTLGEYGILIPTCDKVKYKAKHKITKEEENIADAIIKLLDDEKLYNKYKKACEKRIKDFSKEKILNKWKKNI